MGSKQHIQYVTELIKTVKNDRRDEWPDVPKSYIKGENLSSGHFGAIRFAECRNQLFGFHGLDVRHTVLRELFMDLYILNRCRHEHVMHSHAPISVLVIAKILRQLCLGLDYLQRIGIVHRDVEPENIYLTRKGTVKLGHFGQAFALVDDRDKPERCKSPLFNLYKTTSTDEELEYDFASDIWSLGVLVLRMVSYFPEEKGQKLPNDFALTMGERKMPFHYFIVEMMQLRSRLVQSGGEKLKKFVSEKLLTAKPEKRATAVSLLETPEMKSWCLAHVDEDKVFIRSKLINEVDFANRLKLEEDAPNYNCLESKDIPAEFYWDDTWKDLENSEFCVKLSYSNGSHLPQEYRFKFGSSEPLFKILYKQYLKGWINLFDILPLDYEIKELIYKLMAARSEKLKESVKIDSLNKSICLTNSQLNSTSEVIRERWSMSTQLLPLIFVVFFTSFFGIVVAQTSLINPQARLCSFTDDSTGYSVFWHTNCTGYVNFVLNFRNFPIYGNLWTGIGFGLISLELVLVEAVNGFVNVQPAKLYPGQPPQKNLAAPYLVAPRGNFLHTREFIDWLQRMDAPYGGQPYSKQICNVAETCSRNNCVRGQLPYDSIYNYGNSPYSRPQQNLFGNSAFQQPIVTPSLQRNDQLYGTNYVYGSQPLYDQYGQYNTFRQPAQMGYAQSPYTGQYQNQFMTQQRFYNPQQQYGYDSTRQRAPTLTQIFSQYDAASNTNQRLYNGYLLPAREYPCTVNRQRRSLFDKAPSGSDNVAIDPMKSLAKRQIQNSANGFQSSLKGTAYEGQDDQFIRTTPYFDSPYRPAYLNNNPATVTTYNIPQVKYYNDGRGNYGLPSLDNNTPWRFFDPGMNNTPMYYPYRTAVFDNTQMLQNYGRGNLRMNDANFRQTDPIKCDKGTDPSWCPDYVREFVHWQQRYEGKTPQGICNTLRDSLRNSDHQCCNTLKNIQC
ncbi:protein kinase domain-containing protein [Ditylenchus destructor]|nr:protein kinase domain-containing protein [Ditylenchus destructor]